MGTIQLCYDLNIMLHFLQQRGHTLQAESSDAILSNTLCMYIFIISS